MEKKTKLLILFTIGVLFGLIACADVNFQPNNENSVIKLSNGQIPVSPIFINDTDPNYSWSKTAEDYEWCTGNVTDGYIIENVIINGQNSASCIKIINSYIRFEIRNCVLYNAGTGNAGIELKDVQGAHILNSNSSFNGGKGISLINCQMCNISGNIITYNLDNGISVVGGTVVNIEKNSINGHINTGIYLESLTNCDILDNQLNNNNYGIRMYDSSTENMISGNIIQNDFSGYEFGIAIYNSDNNTISSNRIKNYAHRAIYLRLDSDYNEVWYNILEDNANGIVISLSDNNDVSDNNIKGSKYAIDLSESHYNNVSLNKLSNNDYAIQLYGVEFSTIFENFIFGNDYGVYLEYRCYNNIIKSNNISYNENGLIIDGLSDNNLIFKNNFTGNTKNVEDNSYGLSPITYHSNYADQVLSFRGLSWGTAFPRVDGDSSLIAPAISSRDNWNLFLEADYPYYTPDPNWVWIRWGNYENFEGITHQYLSTIQIHYRVMAEGGWKPWNILDQAGPLILRVYDDVGNYQDLTIATTPGDTVYYDTNSNRAPWDISSGAVFDRVKQGGYIKSCAALMYVYEPATQASPIPPFFTLTLVWVNIDFLDIVYYTSIPDPGVPSYNQWDNGTIGNIYDNYVGEDLNDDGIGDDPYTILGTAGAIDYYPIFSDKFELTMDIIPDFLECYMGDDINFTIALTDYFGDGVNLPLDIIEEKAYWDAHNWVRTHFTSFTNYSGTIFQNETGIPFATLNDIYLLNFTMYPYGSLMVAPEILEYNSTSQYSRQKIEIYFQLDLDYLFNLYNLGLKDISYINATLFGAHFLELACIDTLIDSFGRIEVYNYQDDTYFTYPISLFDEVFKLGDPNNPLNLGDIPDYSFDFTANNLSRYVDPNNVITFRFFSYFEGYLKETQGSYLSDFEANAVLGTWLDYISFNVVWWEETSEKIYYNDTKMINSGITYTYNPTCPGTYTIFFEVRPHLQYKSIEGNFTIEVKRRPVNLTLDLTTQAYTTDNLDIIANVKDLKTGAPAISAKVNFYSNYSGSIILLGTSFTDAYGFASITVTNLFQGDYEIYAEVEENHGQLSPPFKDEPFDNDIWAHNISDSYELHIKLTPTRLELLSLAPEGYDDLIVNQNFYIFPRLINNNSDLEIYYENIKIYVNSTLIGIFNSSTPVLINFSKPGKQIVQCLYDGSELFNRSESTTIFNAKRLELTIKEVSPSESIYYPNQQISITILAMDLSTNLPIEGLTISLYTNETDIFLTEDTDSEGLVIFTFSIPEDWASKSVSYYAFNSPIPNLYLQRRTNESSIYISPFATDILFTTEEINMYVNESYTFTFDLWNELQGFIDNEPLTVTIYNEDVGDIPEYTDLYILTADNNSLNVNFSAAGIYKIDVDYEGAELYLQCYSNFTFEVLRRPTYITVDVTDNQLVPGNEFSITVNLFDGFTNDPILYEVITVFENIYDNGTVVSESQFDVFIPVTNTFYWKPLRAADFEFTFYFETYGNIYENSYYSIILNVSKRQVLIEPSIQNFNYQIDEFIRFNTTFIDLNTTDLDSIPGLLVHYLILDGENIIYSQNHTANEEGVIAFEWQIPSDLINKTLTILIITEESNYYQSYYEEIEVTTAPLETYFTITVQPNPHGFLNEEIIFEIELLSIRGETVEDTINYEIICEELLYYESGVINLGETSTLIKLLAEAGRYVFKFSYLGSDIYIPTEKDIIYYIDLYPSTLNLIDYPDFIYSVDQAINLTYQLIDTFTLEPISGSLIKLFYIDLASSTKIFLDLEGITDLDGKVNFSVTLPETYSDSSIIFIAEADPTLSNEGASNSVELIITESPTFINFATLTDSYQYYIDDTLNITFELFDYFDNLLITESLYLEIETPTTYLNFMISCNQTIKLNFTDLGLYRVNATYEGSSFYLPANTQVFYGVSPIPTSLEFTEEIPELLYSDQHLFLRAQLNNSITNTPLEGELVKFFVANDTSTVLIYNGLTESEGLISYIWDIDPAFIGQNVKIFAVFEYFYYYENCSSSQASTYISKYDVELSFIEIPDLLSPFIEEHFIVEAYKVATPSVVAENCHIQVLLLLPNGSYVLIKDGFTDNFGILEFDWMPDYNIFVFNEATLEIYIIEDELYYGGLILSELISINKLGTYILINPEKSQVLPGETISIFFDLIDVYGERLYGETIFVEITNPLYTISFEIEIGFNNLFEFLVPNYGTFDIIANYEGNDRHHPCTNSTLLFSEKFELQIELSILEAFSSTESSDFLGTYLNYSTLDFNNNLTLVANVTIKNYDISFEGAEVFFFFLQKNKEPILIGSNITNEEGIAIFYWDTSNYSTPDWWKNTALLAIIDETVYNYAVESNPIYFNLRKIDTSLAIGLFTSEFRINVNYTINITLYDEFLIKLKGYNISVDIYFKGKIIKSYELITNDTTHFNFIPSELGNYIIKVYFAGTEEYKESHITEMHKCIEKEPTNIKIYLPEYIKPGQLYSIKIILFNSTGGLLVGELVKVDITYHDDSGATEYFYLVVMIGDNNTFDWIFPDYDEYVIKATYKGNDDYLGCKVHFIAKSIINFRFSFWELFFFLLVPGLMLSPSYKIKTSKWKRRKQIFMVMFFILTILFSSYAGITFICSQTERKGLIKDLKGVSNYSPENLLSQQKENTMNDLFDYGASTLEKVNPEWIPNIENNSESYDLVIEDSTVIPPELDKNPPYLDFYGLSNGDTLIGTTQIKVTAFDRESGIQTILFKLLYQGITLVKEGVFKYEPSSDLYVYNLSTTEYDDGNYIIHASAIDYNYNKNNASLAVKIVNHPVYDIGETEFENVKVELTDYVNVSFSSTANGSYILEVIDLNYKTITKISGPIAAQEINTFEIFINPLRFKATNYKILITILMTAWGGIVVKETQELNLEVLKESVKLELEIEEGEEIYSDHYVYFKARLIENDGYLSESGEFIVAKPDIPIPGQVLTFEISDTDNSKILGTVVTDINGYAKFNYYVSLGKGQHMFNVTFRGNNIYQPLEGMKLFKNKGKYMNMQLTHVSSEVQYNEVGTITAVLLADEIRIANQTLYFNISNSFNNYYLGMATTDLNGEATITFPCDYSPGEYDVIVSYDGKSIYADNVSVFEERLNITQQDVDLTIQTGMGSDIYCPYYYNTTLVAKLLDNQTYNGIEDIILTFEAILFPEGPYYQIGNSTTDSYGLASINFNPSLISNLIPGNYMLNVISNSNDFYKEGSDIASLVISKDIPIISIQGTETLFHTTFQINATLTDSLLNTIQGAELSFYILNGSDPVPLKSGSAFTNINGVATFIVPAEEFPYIGKFDIFVFFDGIQNAIYNSTSSMVKHGLQVNYHATQLLIQGPEKGNVIDPYEIDLFLIDNEAMPITGQKILIECYKEGGITNLLMPNTHVITDILYGNATFSLYIAVPGTFIIKALYLPLSDDDMGNNGFLSSYSEIRFTIERVPADLSITKTNLPRIMRGDLFEFTVEAGLEEAKREDIPINIFVDIDLNGDGIKYDDIFRGKYCFIENGTGVISYKIPMDGTFQAGQYMFTVVIDEEWSSFTGNTSFLIDFIERTTLEIRYHILNPNANGKHYLWEEEKIEFILKDEDKDPLPASCTIKNGSIIGINRSINYQIVNGKNIYGTTEVDLNDGNFTLEHTPTTYGFETCTVVYEGARFFAPSNSRKVEQILRRPLILTFIDYWHNNQERQTVPHSGHRGEYLTIIATVQDYLNGTFLPNQIVQFGHSGRFFGVSNRSNSNGWIYLNVELNDTNNLIQAGDYHLNLKISMNDYYQSAIATHSDLLHIFEIGFVWMNIGAVSMEDMNYVVRPTIFLFDEDLSVVRNVPFYIQVVDLRTNQVVHSQNMISGRVEIPIMDGGIYQIRVSVDEHIISQSPDIQEIASYLTENFHLFLLTKSAAILIIDAPIPTIWIPLISDVLFYALEFGAKWKSEIWTFLILLALNIFSGTLGQQIRFTWVKLLKVILFTVFCGIFSPIRDLYYKFLETVGIVEGIRMVINVLSSPNWFNLGISLVIGGYGLIHAITGSNATKPKLLDFSISKLLLELGILALAGFVEYIFHNAQGILGLLGNAFGALAKMLWDKVYKYDPIKDIYPLGQLLILIITDTLISLVIDIIFSLIPPISGFLGFLIDLAREILKISLIVIVNVVINIYFGLPTMSVSEILKQIVGQIVKQILTTIVLDLLKKIPPIKAILELLGI